MQLYLATVCWTCEFDAAALFAFVAGRIDVRKHSVRRSASIDKRRGTIKIGENQYAELEPYQGATGVNTTLTDTIFSTVPGAPVFVGKSSQQAALGIDVDLKGHNALQSTFVFDA